MEKVWTDVVRWGAAVAGAVAGFFGGWTMGSKILVALMVMDYVLGCMCALAGKSPKTESGHFWSQVAFTGLLKKGVIMLVILVAALLDRVLGGSAAAAEVAGGQHAAMFRSAAEFFYIATEALSIVENAGLMGVPVPKPLRRALEVLREENDKGEEEK